MQDFPISISEANFYITNVCNLTCNNCITFSNLDFKGHYYWETYKDKISLWPKFIKPRKITIIGGEPFSNPDILNWVCGVRSLWPTHDNFTVATNGTFFRKKKYLEIAKEIVKLKIRLEVSVHSPKDYQNIKDNLLSLLKEMEIPYRVTWQETDLSDRKDDLPKGMTLEDLKGKDDETKFIHLNQGYTLFTLSRKYLFQSNAIKFIDKKNISMYQSNSEESHKKCCYKDFHYIYKGDLYKCHVPAVGQDFTSQFNVDDRSLSLIKNYRPCNPTDSADEIRNFLLKIENSIESCSVCPSKLNIQPALS